MLYGELGDWGTLAIYALTWILAKLVFHKTWASFQSQMHLFGVEDTLYHPVLFFLGLPVLGCQRPIHESLRTRKMKLGGHIWICMLHFQLCSTSQRFLKNEDISALSSGDEVCLASASTLLLFTRCMHAVSESGLCFSPPGGTTRPDWPGISLQAGTVIFFVFGHLIPMPSRVLALSRSSINIY